MTVFNPVTDILPGCSLLAGLEDGIKRSHSYVIVNSAGYRQNNMKNTELQIIQAWLSESGGMFSDKILLVEDLSPSQPLPVLLQSCPVILVVGNDPIISDKELRSWALSRKHVESDHPWTFQRFVLVGGKIIPVISSLVFIIFFACMSKYSFVNLLLFRQKL